MTSHSDSSIPSADELLNELRTLIAEADTLMNDKINAPTADAVSALRARFQRAQGQLSTLYANTRRQVMAGARYTDEAIRTHPYPSVGIALAAGLLIGVLVGRRCCGGGRSASHGG